MTRVTPYSAFRFTFHDETGQIVAGFSEASGITGSTKFAEYRAGSDLQSNTVKVPTGREFEHLMLKRGVVDSTTFWDWMNEVWTSGPQAKRNIRLVMQSESNQDVQSWKFTGAFPIKYTAPPLAASPGTELAVEEWQLAFDVMEFKQEGVPD
ncbi:MAG: phage tail-like protein [Ascidiaceihabitans sp.]|jgi:phage tail-like protein